MRVFAALFVTLVMLGCQSKIVLAPSPTIPAASIDKRCSIGIDDVRLPAYLLAGELPVYEGKSKSSYGVKFVEDIEELFVKRSIDYLHRAFPSAKVGRYPWDFESEPDLVVRVRIAELSIDEKSRQMVLRGQIELGGRSYPLTLHTPVDGGVEQAFDRLFASYLRTLARAVDRSCPQVRDTPSSSRYRR